MIISGVESEQNKNLIDDVYSVIRVNMASILYTVVISTMLLKVLKAQG